MDAAPLQTRSSTGLSTSSAGPAARAAPGSTTTTPPGAGPDYGRACGSTSLRAGPRDSVRRLKERLLFAEALEALDAYDSGVIESTADANVGSLLGIGFPSWTGGVLRYIDQYDGGPAGFAHRAAELAGRYGQRFTPPPRCRPRGQHVAA